MTLGELPSAETSKAFQFGADKHGLSLGKRALLLMDRQIQLTVISSYIALLCMCIALGGMSILLRERNKRRLAVTIRNRIGMGIDQTGKEILIVGKAFNLSPRSQGG